MKKVTLINPPQNNALDDHLDPPLGLMYIASNLEKNGYSPKIVDLTGNPERQLERNWPKIIGNGDIYGISIVSVSFDISRRIAQIIKQYNPKAHIVAGGAHPTSMPEHTLSFPEFDTVIRGEGEVELVNIANWYYAGKKIPRIINAKRLENLDDFPMPARHLVDLKEYTRNVDGDSATSLITSRGCPYNCTFCCRDIHGQKVRFHSVDRVIEEVKEIKNRYGIRSLLFYDDVFTININGRLDELCRRLKPLDIGFRCNGRVGVNKPEDYVKLREAGCEEIAFGIESGSQKILNAMNKRVTVEQNIETIRQAKKAGLLVKAYLISGFPGETQETIDETKRFMEIADPDKFTVSAFVPLPGCDVWNNPSKYDILGIDKDWNQYFNRAGQYQGGTTFETPCMSKETFLRLHEDLVSTLMKRGQRGKLEKYDSKIRRKE